ncbi:MAG: hypothetical protein U9Q15_03660, partial [Patescibacteria group bacterium]|nr:hypothetical protein [Patescibacteria group bacterium]
WGKDLIRMIPGNKGSHSQDWNYGYMQESEVAPNEIGNFVINLDIQSDPGKNKEYYNLEYAKNTQFHDEFHFFDYTVASEEFIGKFISQTSYPDLFYGESYLFETRWRNDGQTPWTKDQLFLVNKSHGFQMHMLEDIVHP